MVGLGCCASLTESGSSKCKYKCVWVFECLPFCMAQEFSSTATIHLHSRYYSRGTTTIRPTTLYDRPGGQRRRRRHHHRQRLLCNKYWKIQKYHVKSINNTNLQSQQNKNNNNFKPNESFKLTQPNEQ